MKYAIIADIHANLEALQAVLQDMKLQGCTHTACLGDIVGYCTNPKECLDIIRAMNIPCVKGNHDEYCAADAPLDGLNPMGAQAVEWSRRQLTEEDRKWLGNLPAVLAVETFTIVHATLEQPERWGYVADKLSAASSFQHQQKPVCFYGHTHLPLAFVRDSAVRGGTFKEFKIEHGKQYFVNPGSVGQPRDGNPKAAYVTYDLDSRTIVLRRVDYDIPSAQAKIRAAGLPPRLE